jgi:hypothetical protein
MKPMGSAYTARTKPIFFLYLKYNSPDSRHNAGSGYRQQEFAKSCMNRYPYTNGSNGLGRGGFFSVIQESIFYQPIGLG